ncbi:squalene synthase HpnC [Ramlibacter tataouinensis]|uniref:squalene synthase HpnC n=1 Tax=Ramlibacter tataouinensis TaxID=94132 RepID=UPI0022F40519|nr:squalene synthase HpnC [Ramlibacter tataouinensis]WBY01618.1 squalene synthase HpnC [Ramlibacter tataouinensis]
MTANPSARSVDHYENFPVASWLCPPRLRPVVAAIYWFARTADDLADEGSASPAQRLAALAEYRADLAAAATAGGPSARWPQVFGPLAGALRDWRLPLPLLQDLLSAFEQDVARTRDGAGYRDRAELLDYCRRSANPVGRLMLHLYQVEDAASLARSDAICTALQLINFWQDIGQDLARGRRYLPEDDCRAHGVDPLAPADSDPGHRQALVRDECAWARGLMLEGAPLVHRVPGRAGWELRGVVQGGLRILDRIEALGFDTFLHRPKLRPLDLPLIAARMVRM